MTDSNQIIKDAFENLPKVVQDVLTSSDLSAKLQGMAKKHNLHLDKWSLLENEIALALLGITDPVDLAGNIAKNVGVEATLAQHITNDGVEMIFEPIRIELEKAVEKKNQKEGVVIPVEQKQALAQAGVQIPHSVEEAQPKTLDAIIAKRVQDVAPEKAAMPQMTAFSAAPAQIPVAEVTAQAPVPSVSQKESLPKNTAADSSHMRKTIENDLYREQI